MPTIVTLESVPWEAHSRFPGVKVKKLLSSSENELASVNLILIPPGCEIGWHSHTAQTETVYLLRGQGCLTIAATEQSFSTGQIVAIPSGLEHTLRNTGLEPLELMAFFTPPL